MKITKPQTRVYFMSAIILLVGLAGAILIYLTAANDSSSGFGYDDSKMYMHDLELYGGKVNVLANKFLQWLAGLWEGKSLAFTVACISIFISFVFFLCGSNMTSASQSDVRGKNNKTGPGQQR